MSLSLSRGNDESCPYQHTLSPSDWSRCRRCTRAGDLALARQVAMRCAMVPPETSALELAEWLEQAGAKLEVSRVAVPHGRAEH